MQRTQSLVRVLTVLGMTLAIVLIGHQAQRASAQAAGETDITIISVVADDPADARFQAAYTYLVDAGSVDGVTASASGTETYQAYDGDSGDILDTQAVGADGTVTLVVPVGLNNHVININDPGNGSEAVSGGSTVTVVINPGASSEPTAEQTYVNVVSGTVDDGADALYPATYTYSVLPPGHVACCGNLTRSPVGSETYQAYSDIDGSILDTEAVSNGDVGTASLNFPSGIPYHIININDPGAGSERLTGSGTVIVAINPNAGAAPTAAPAQAPSLVPTVAPSVPAGTGSGTGSGGNSGTGSGGTALPNTGTGTVAVTSPLGWLVALVLALTAIAATGLTLRRRSFQR